MKLYIAVLEDAPVYMVPTLVAHSVLGAHLVFQEDEAYLAWLELSFKKCVLKVNFKEFNKLADLDKIYLGHENTILNGEKSCCVICPREEYPNVIKFAKLWKP
jgi:hypothetical protein